MMMEMGFSPPPPSARLLADYAANANDAAGCYGGQETKATTKMATMLLSSPPFVIEEWHEFVIIYEGPPPSSSEDGRDDEDVVCSKSRQTQKNRQTFCLSLPPSVYYAIPDDDENNGKSSRGSSSHVSERDLLTCASIRIGWPAQLLCCRRGRGQTRPRPTQRQHPSFHPTHSAYHPPTRTVHHHHAIPISITLRPKYASVRGGKGGFGTLLRGQSKQAGAKRTVDFGACRDLSGRRLRHVNDELKLRKWNEVEEARRRLRAAAAADSAGGRGGAADADGGVVSNHLAEVELAALRTPSGIRNWHLSIPSCSDMASSTTSNKGRRRMDRQLEREVRGYRRNEERMREERERKRMEQETSLLEYVRRGEMEGERVSSVAGSVKEEILAHYLRKRKQLEERDGSRLDEVEEEGDTKRVIDDNSELGRKSVSSSLSSYLMTISGEMLVLDSTLTTTTPTTTAEIMISSRPLPQRIQSQSDFSTAVVLLDDAKLREMRSRGGKGVYVEYTIQTAGLAQIGWIRSPSHRSSRSGIAFHPNSDTGDGVGDDAASYGYDGSRGLKFHGGGEETAYGPMEEDTTGIIGWKSGDTLGSYCKFAESSVTAKNDDEATSNYIEIGYTLNGLDLGIAFTIPMAGDDSFHLYPALSLNLDEVVDVNVGPEFAHKCMDGCVGAVELVMSEASYYEAGETETNQVDEGEDGSLENNDNEKSPSPKRPREDPLVEPEIIVNETLKTNTTEEGGMDTSSQCANDNTFFDLNNCNSVDELKVLGPDRLKNIMLSMGVKCGGTTEERANRLYSLKGLRRSEYPNKVRGKNFIL